MTSPARIAASRLNGAKSRGPKTQAGKARSRSNATKHGLSRNPLPGPESDQSFHQAFAELLHQFPNPDPLELGRIHRIAAARSRLNALSLMEQQWLDELIAAQPAGTGPQTALANAFAALADTHKFQLLQRHQDRAWRQYFSALETLLEYRNLKNDQTNLELPSLQRPPLARHPITHHQFPEKPSELPRNSAENSPQSLQSTDPRPRHTHRLPQQTRGKPDPAPNHARIRLKNPAEPGTLSNRSRPPNQARRR